ncbi:M23 family metallopeptidase [uncultured Vagococcus sp.]|uniref:M23 family metallopeptidase n=1 Tax=uncultured Vagococcus sp. TaxID=189676 RepID=UPI0028D5F0E2|nr:M23 family metallopeptidase [uncultured Vagococcus sp.]
MAIGWGWPFPKVGEGSFSGGQLFGKNPGGEFRPNGFHNGLDFGSVDHPGSEICAIHDGTVVFAGWAPSGYEALGTVVATKSDDGYYVVYQEFGTSTANIRVSVGQKVTLGQVVATRNTSHLHLGVTKTEWLKAQSSAFSNNGVWLDPRDIIKKGIFKPIPNDRTPHNVITYWYPSETNGGFKLVTEYCKSRGWGYRVVKNDKGQLKIVVGWFHQDSEGKFELEKLLADHNLAYTVKLHGEGDGASSNSSKQDIVTYWYPNEANAGYQKVINFCKIKGWGYRLEKNSKGQIKIIVGWFHVNFSGKIELEKFLAANNYNYVVDFFY